MDYIQENNRRYHDSAVRYPNDHRGVRWSSTEAQFLRFKVLCNISPDIYTSSILDVGCGLGHLVDHLISQSFQGTYTGIDLSHTMVLRAKKRHPTYSFESNHLDNIEKHSSDYVLASGLFAFSSWDDFKETVPALLSCARKGVAFNCLCDTSKTATSDMWYANLNDALDFCKTLTPDVTLQKSYLDNDFTIYLYKK